MKRRSIFFAKFKILNVLLILVSGLGYSQTISVNNSQNSPQQLVDLLLGNACVEVENVSVSSEESVAYFSNNGGAFPISEGVIIRSGKAIFSEGAYDGQNHSSQLNTTTDQYLQGLNDASGQSTGITDVAFLEFDFEAVSHNFNFNFLFASNEYGNWQCVSSDVFAFLLTDMNTGETSNLAVIPGTSTPVSVKSIKDQSYNASCESSNAGFFASYEVDNPDSSVNMRGYTEVMTASADITPGHSYNIRLVIGDSYDADFDSAIFLSAGSFNATVDLGGNQTICEGEETVLSTGLNANIYQHTWTFNGEEIIEANGSSINVGEAGEYAVTVTKSDNGCFATNQMTLNFLEVQEPSDLVVCGNPTDGLSFNLLTNNPASLGLNPENYQLHYYASQEDLNNNFSIPENQLEHYISAGDQTIFVKVANSDNNNFCDPVFNFDLQINDALPANTPDPIEVCVNSSVNPSLNLNQVRSQITGGLPLSPFQFGFFHSLEDAENNENKITNPGSYSLPLSPEVQTIWVRIQDPNFPACYNTVSFEIILNEPAPITNLSNAYVCHSYILPEIEFGNYYTGPQGSGTPLFPGDEITTPSTIYIFSGPNAAGCPSQSSFSVLVLDGATFEEDHCGQFVVPHNPFGSFFTALDGPNGVGESIPVGTVITESQEIFFYSELNGQPCVNQAFSINILPLPPVDSPAPVISCNSYTLPELSNGNYFSLPNGNGTQYMSGDVITASGDIYIYNENATCSNESILNISLVSEFQDIEACGSYTLPTVVIGGFFTEPGGQGQNIPSGSVITTSQTIYFYAATNTFPNCTDNLSYHVNILPLPEVDSLEDIVLCESESFVLPELQNGEYFSEANRNGNQLFAGDIISESATVYINNLVNTCSNETSFMVEIRDLPPVEDFTDIYSCGPYELPVLINGSYFTGSGGTGETLHAGDLIETEQTIYIYNQWEDLSYCTNEDAFTVYVNGVDVGEFEDVSVCDFYILPELNVGSYYTQSGGLGEELEAGQTITTDLEVFVYELYGDRFSCADEDSFFINISKKPKLSPIRDVLACFSYTLPALSPQEPSDVATIGYYWQPGGQQEILPSEYEITTPGSYTIYVHAASIDNPGCYTEVSFTVVLAEVNVGEFENVLTCDSYMLPELTSGKYFTATGGEGTELFPGDVIESSMEIFVFDRIANGINCTDEASFFIDIVPSPKLENYNNIEVCGSYTLPELSQEKYNLGYYWEAGGMNEILPSEFTISTPGTYTIYVFAKAYGNSNCTTEESFVLIVNPLLDLNIEGATLCRNNETGVFDSPVLLSSGLNPNEFEVHWFLNNTLVHTGQDFLTDVPGEYVVETIKLTEDVGANCNYNPTVVVVEESSKPIVSYEVTEPFSDIAVITVHVENGNNTTYEYKINNGLYQSSNEFYDVQSGTHMIRVRGVGNECGETVLPVEVLKFPKFFTPNNDGFNDYWNIKDLVNHPEGKIEIFDRYGKLITIISTSGNGWDGTFHGKALFSSDFWFKVRYEMDGVQREFKSHFTLKR
ncbi:MAG TPA: choice-of-anchor L domain-containing protein [Salinimicrobium sp.]|nr:choice-of-anchor L domain-containing protein [Salinimicrobium sp.]